MGCLTDDSIAKIVGQAIGFIIVFHQNKLVVDGAAVISNARLAVLDDDL